MPSLFNSRTHTLFVVQRFCRSMERDDDESSPVSDPTLHKAHTGHYKNVNGNISTHAAIFERFTSSGMKKPV